MGDKKVTILLRKFWVNTGKNKWKNCLIFTISPIIEKTRTYAFLNSYGLKFCTKLPSLLKIRHTGKKDLFWGLFRKIGMSKISVRVFGILTWSQNIRSPKFLTMISMFWPKFWFLNKILIFDEKSFKIKSNLKLILWPYSVTTVTVSYINNFYHFSLFYYQLNIHTLLIEEYLFLIIETILYLKSHSSKSLNLLKPGQPELSYRNAQMYKYTLKINNKNNIFEKIRNVDPKLRGFLNFLKLFKPPMGL